MKITVKNLQKKIPISPKRAKEAVLSALSSKDTKKSGEITVCFVNDKKIRDLNARFHGRDASTDVLAFDLGLARTKGMLADIVVSVETAARNAIAYNTSALYEAYLYVVHGALHLAGWQDAGCSERRRMQAKAEAVLAKLRIKKGRTKK